MQVLNYQMVRKLCKTDSEYTYYTDGCMHRDVILTPDETKLFDITIICEDKDVDYVVSYIDTSTFRLDNLIKEGRTS